MRYPFRQFIQLFLNNHCLLCDLHSHDNLICSSCTKTLPVYGKSRIPPSNHIDNVYALFDYTAPISHFIWRLKFHGDLSIAHWFSNYWITFLKSMSVLPECIIPVPLHPLRLKERGFNQSIEIARPIGHYFDMPVDTRSCIKIKNTIPQMMLSGEKRKHNLKNAFGLSYSIDAKHVAILDDVMTTGNTVSELAELLKKSGVEKVDVWCCACVSDAR